MKAKEAWVSVTPSSSDFEIEQNCVTGKLRVIGPVDRNGIRQLRYYEPIPLPDGVYNNALIRDIVNHVLYRRPRRDQGKRDGHPRPMYKKGTL